MLKCGPVSVAQPKSKFDVAALIAGAVGVVASIAWIMLWLTPPPDDEAVQKAPAPSQSQSRPQPPPQPSAPAPPQPVPKPPPVVEAPPSTPPRAQPEIVEQKAPKAPAPVAAKPAKPEHAPQAAAKAPPAKSAAPDPAAAALVGRYVGTYGGDSGTGFTLEIASVTNGVVSGLVTLGGSGCRGRYPVEGTFKAGRLQMRAPRKGGPASDCPLGFTLTVDGNKLTGATDAGEKIVLRR